MTRDEYGQVYQLGFSRTVGLLCSRGASPDRAEDIAQAAWLQGWRRLHQLRSTDRIGSWIGAIALNYQRSWGRREGRFRELSGLELSRAVQSDTCVLDIERILQACPPGDRKIFELQLEGFSAQEIAGLQGSSAGAIRLRLFRARQAARARTKGLRRLPAPRAFPLSGTLFEVGASIQA